MAQQSTSSSGPYCIKEADFDDERVLALLRKHFEFCMDPNTSPIESIRYVLDIPSLQNPKVTLWTLWTADLTNVLGCAALKDMGNQEGEVKSMHVLSTSRGSGIADVLINHVIAQAKARGLQKLYLETGSTEGFARARRFYGKYKFVECEVYGDYEFQKSSSYMVRDL